MEAIETHWADLVAGLPARVRPVASVLPATLGLSATPPGRWTDFTGLPPMQDLPTFAAEGLPPNASTGLEASCPRLDTFRQAHWRGGYLGLLRDRIADGQSHVVPDRAALDRCLRRAWIDRLGEGLNDRPRAQQWVRRTLRRLRRGIVRQREVLHLKRLAWDRYGAIIEDKSDWLLLSAWALLWCGGTLQTQRLSFMAAGRLMLRGLQCIDDGLDHEEDRAQQGCGWADALGVDPAVLVMTGCALLDQAGEVATAGGFVTLGGWLSSHHAQMQKISIGQRSARRGLAALGLSSALASSVRMPPACQTQP